MGVVDILRRVTAMVKLFPFYYAGALLLFWLIAPAMANTTLKTIGSLIYLSAIMTVFLIRLSYCLKLCIWHRIQCALPLLPQVVEQVDKHIFKFGFYLAIAEYVVMWLIFTLSLINAYFVIIKPAVRK